MNLKNLLLSLILITPNLLLAQINDKHLEPVNGIFDVTGNRIYYGSKVREYLIDGLYDYPKVRFFKFPSRDPEEVFNLTFDRSNNVWEIKYRTRGVMIHRLNESDITKFPIDEIHTIIPSELGESLYELCVQMINLTKFYENEKTGMDGINYYFSVFDGKIKAGQIWSPRPNSKTGKLVKICEEVIKYITGELNSYSEILNDINELNIDIKKR